MANVIMMRGISNINRLPSQLRAVTVQKPFLCSSATSLMMTVKRNFKNAGDKEDYSVKKLIFILKLKFVFFSVLFLIAVMC
jgi:hypothetical protein